MFPLPVFSIQKVLKKEILKAVRRAFAAPTKLRRKK